MWYSLLLLGYKPVRHVTVLNNVGNCITVVSIIILYYDLMGLPSYMRSVFDRNVVMRRIPVLVRCISSFLLTGGTYNFLLGVAVDVLRCRSLRTQQGGILNGIPQHTNVFLS
jgi:hypothetical protein